MIQRGIAENNLLSGISVDRDPAVVQKDTLTDAVNMTTSPTDGSKHVYQSVKSTVPETSLHQHFYNTDTNVVEMEQIPVITTGNALGRSMLPVDREVKLHECYFKFNGHKPEIEDTEGKDGFEIQLSVAYFDAPETFIDLTTIKLKNLKENNTIKLNHKNGSPIDSGKVITSLNCKTYGFSVFGRSLGTFDFFGELPKDSHYNIGPSAVLTEVTGNEFDIEKDGIKYKLTNKKILGAKTYDNITYFVIGNPKFIHTEERHSNNVGTIPIDHWNNAGISNDKFKPDFNETDNEDTLRDTITTPLNTSEIAAKIGLKRDKLAYEVDRHNDRHSVEKLTSRPVGIIPVSGNYTFHVTAELKVNDSGRKSSEVNTHFAFRLIVKRDDGTDYELYTTRGNHYDFTWHGNLKYAKHKLENNLNSWDKYFYKKDGASSQVLTKSILLTDLKQYDNVFIEVITAIRGKGRISYDNYATVDCDTQLVVDTSINETNSKKLSVEDLLSDISTPVSATTNLHYNGQINIKTKQLDKADEVIKDNDIGEIERLFLRDRKDLCGLGGFTFEWTKARKKSRYRVQYLHVGARLTKDKLAPSTPLWKDFAVVDDERCFFVPPFSDTIKSEYNYFWFRVRPENENTVGNYIGGYYRFTVRKTNNPFALFVDTVDNLITIDPVGGARDSAISATPNTVVPPVSNLMYAINYMDFTDFSPDGTAQIHGLPAGTHKLYLKYYNGASTIYTYKDITIGSEHNFEDYEMTTSVDMSGTKDITNFDLKVKVNDPGNHRNIFKVVLSPYKSLSVEGIEALANGVENIDFFIVGSNTYTTIPVVQRMYISGNLYVYAFSSDMRDDMYPQGIHYRSSIQMNSLDKIKHYYRICKGRISINNNLRENRYNLEIGSYPSPFYGHVEGDLLNVYQPLQNLDYGAFITDKVTLNQDNYVDIEIQPAFDGSVNIIMASEGDVPRIINSGFSTKSDNRYELIVGTSEKTSSIYRSKDVENATRLIQTESSIVDVELKSINPSGGSLEVGSYKFIFKLATLEGNETDFLAETGMIPIFFGEDLGSIQGGGVGTKTTKSLDFRLSNLDTNYNHVVVYMDHCTGANQVVSSFYKLDKNFIILDDSEDKSKGVLDITISGFERKIIVSEDEKSTQKQPVSSVKTVAQVQNRLFLGNFTEKDVDYNKLLKVGTQILVVPTRGPKTAPFNDIMGAWPDDSMSQDLHTFSGKYLSQKIDSVTLPDINKIRSGGVVQLTALKITQGYHNAAFVERYAAYWPKETYKYAVCFITNNNLLTRPVPVSGSDYSNTVLDNLENTSDIEGYYSSVQDNLLKSIGKWVSTTDKAFTFNTLGVCRFPRQLKPNDIYFPRFIFNIDKFNEVYPGFSSEFKGIFFTRTKRKPDVIMQGFTGPVLATLTDKTVIQDEDPDKYVPKTDDTNMDVYRACVPALYGGLGIYAFEKVKDEKGMNWSIANEEDAGAFVTNMLDGSLEDKKSYTDSYKPLMGESNLNKVWFKSSDMFGNFPQVSADFNGKTYGLDPVSFLTDSSIKNKELNTNFKSFKEGSDTTVPIHKLQAIKSSLCVLEKGSLSFSFKDAVRLLSTPNSSLRTVHKITPDYRPYGLNTRSAGGFSSLIPFRSLTRVINDPDGKKVFTYLSGVFTEYVGITSPTIIDEGIYNIYPSSSGSISEGALRDMYSNNSEEQHIAITSSYDLSEYEKDVSGRIEIIGTRGDCFLTTGIHNVTRTLPTVSASPASNSAKFNASHAGSTEPNSYRASDASMSIMITHATNYLGYARHTEVVDEAESALYGGPRTFLPISGKADNILGITHSYKLPETNSFNQGYKDNFQGRKLYSVSGGSPYYSKKGPNSIGYSKQLRRNSTYNAFRDFNLGDSKDYASSFGQITKLISLKNNLIATHSSGISMIAINERAGMTTESSDLVQFGTDEVLADKLIPISNNYGSKWQRSVISTGNYIYGVDLDRGKIWRTNGNDLEIISDNCVEAYLKGFTHNMVGKKEVPGERYVASFYDPTKYELIFSIYDRDTAYPNYDIPMDREVFYFLDSLYKAGLAISGDAEKADELLYSYAEEGWYGVTTTMHLQRREDRLLNVNMYLKMRKTITPHTDSKVSNCMTLVYSEVSGTWITRWSVSPEFMFSHNSTMFSISNPHDSIKATNSTIRYTQEYELAIIAGTMTEEDRPFTKLYGEYDSHRPIIWRHEGFNPAIPRYGSFYGKEPIMEIEVMVSQDPTKEKIFDTVSVVGTHSIPAVVLYTTSPENPLLNKVMDKDNYSDYATWEDVKVGYFSMFGHNLKDVANPDMFFKQEVRDRRYNPISRANAIFSNQKLDITISKGMQPMYTSLDKWNRLRNRFLSDKYVKIRLRYDSGEEVKLNAIHTTYSI